jgi:hypothetical protein
MKFRRIINQQIINNQSITNYSNHSISSLLQYHSIRLLYFLILNLLSNKISFLLVEFLQSSLYLLFLVIYSLSLCIFRSLCSLSLTLSFYLVCLHSVSFSVNLQYDSFCTVLLVCSTTYSYSIYLPAYNSRISMKKNYTKHNKNSINSI